MFGIFGLIGLFGLTAFILVAGAALAFAAYVGLAGLILIMLGGGAGYLLLVWWAGPWAWYGAILGGGVVAALFRPVFWGLVCVAAASGAGAILGSLASAGWGWFGAVLGALIGLAAVGKETRTPERKAQLALPPGTAAPQEAEGKAGHGKERGGNSGSPEAGPDR